MGEALALLTAFVWASLNICMRRGVLEKDSGGILNARLIMAIWGLATTSLILGLLRLCDARLTNGFGSFDLRIVALFIVDGFLTKVAALLLLLVSFAQIGASRAAAIRASDAVITSFLSWALLGETFSLLQIGAVIMVALGVAFANLHSETEAVKALPHVKTAGSLIALLAGSCFAVGNVARGAAIQGGGGFLTGVLINYAVSVLIYGAVYFIALRRKNPLLQVGRKAQWYFALAGVLDVLGTFTFFASFTLTQVWLAVTLKNTQPLMVLGLAGLFLRDTEQLNLRILFGVLMVVLGTLVIVSS